MKIRNVIIKFWVCSTNKARRFNDKSYSIPGDICISSKLGRQKERPREPFGFVTINLITHVLTYIVLPSAPFFRQLLFNFGLLLFCFGQKIKIVIIIIIKYAGASRNALKKHGCIMQFLDRKCGVKKYRNTSDLTIQI